MEKNKHFKEWASRYLHIFQLYKYKNFFFFCQTA